MDLTTRVFANKISNLSKRWLLGTKKSDIPSSPGAEFFFAFLVMQKISAIVKGLEREAMSSVGKRGMCLLMWVMEVDFEK